MTAIRAAFKAYRMHQVLIMPRFARLTIALGLATAVFPVDAEYYFNPRFLSNDLAESVDLSAFTKGREAPPGTYRVDIYLNDEFMTSRDITFIADDDNYLSNHNISPRFMTEWDIFADQTSMITAGYNRYYGGNILDMGLRDIRNSWTESVSGNKTLTRYQDLKTPYNDELAMGLQQKIGKNVIARANYVYREAHDQISKSSRTDSATKTTITEYNNDGKTKTHSFNLSFELAEPLHIRQVDINPQIVFSYIKSKGNLSLNNGYEESNTGDNQVVYDGNLVSYDSVPVADFNNPLKISLNMDFTHQPSGLVWANTLAWQEARKARIILGKTNAQYISEYSDYKQYVDEKLDSSLTWDTRLSWTPQFLKQQNLTISADILNVLDSKTAVDTTNTGVATYASGRTFWLDVSMKF